LPPFFCYPVDYLGSNSRLVTQNNHYRFGLWIESGDPCAVRRRTAFAEHRILDYLRGAEINAPANLIRRTAENDDEFVKSGSAFGLRHDPAK
jgi:hypothetical protein